MSQDDNIFDEDDALDYIIYKDLEGENQRQQENNKGQNGCLGGLLVLMVTTGAGLLLILSYC